MKFNSTRWAPGRLQAVLEAWVCSSCSHHVEISHIIDLTCEPCWNVVDSPLHPLHEDKISQRTEDFGDSDFLYSPACERTGQLYCPPGLPVALQRGALSQTGFYVSHGLIKSHGLCRDPLGSPYGATRLGIRSFGRGFGYTFRVSLH